MNPFSFIAGILANMFGSGGTAKSITLTPAQIQALIAAAESFGPMLVGMNPQQVTVAAQLLTAFGLGGLIPIPVPKAP